VRQAAQELLHQRISDRTSTKSARNRNPDKDVLNKGIGRRRQIGHGL
jgi:hypothetical protein